MANILRSIGVAVLVSLAPLALPACGGTGAETGDEQNAKQAAGRFETFKGDDGQHYFQLLAGNGERVLRSEAYTTLANAKKGIASVKKNGLTKGNYKLLSAADGESYFNLVSADNGQIIATSEAYATKSNATRAIKTSMALLKNPTEKPAPTGDAKFETFAGHDNDQYFRLRAKNGEIVLQSEGYSSKSAAEKGIASAAEHGVNIPSYEVLEAQNGQHYFRLLASNGEIIARGETYSSELKAERAVEAVLEIMRELFGGAADDAAVKAAIEQAAEGAVYEDGEGEWEYPFEWVLADLGGSDADVDEALVRKHLANYVDEDPVADKPMSDLLSMPQSFDAWTLNWEGCIHDQACVEMEELHDALEENLTDIQVFYFGAEGEPGNVTGNAVTIFIVGLTPSRNLAGVRTLAIWNFN